MALLSESLRNGSQSALDNCTRIGFLMLERAAISADHFYSLPRTPIAAIEDRHGSRKLRRRGDRNDDPLRVFRVADIHDHCSPHQRDELLNGLSPMLTRELPHIGLDGALLDRSRWAASRVP